MKCVRCNKKKPIFDVGETKLYVCERCGTKWSRLYDYNLKQWKYIEGNFLVPDNEIVIIFAGTQEEFTEAKNKLMKVTGIAERNIARLTHENLHHFRNMVNPMVFVYGTYYVHDDLLGETYVMSLLNNRRML